MTGDRVNRIRERLEDAFRPVDLAIEDEGHLHEGHAAREAGQGHFAVTIRAEAFRGKNPIEAHRMVYEALDDMMKTDIHALRIRASAPGADSA